MEGSLKKQDLFVNQTMATHALTLLWDMFRRATITKNNIWVNLKTHSVRSEFKTYTVVGGKETYATKAQ